MDIVSLPIDIDRKAIDSRFRLVIVAAQRARQIMEGAKPMVPMRGDHKETTTAIEEILSGKLNILYGAAAVTAQQEEKRRREEMKRRAILAEREGELSNEIKKDLSIYLGDASKEEGSAKGKSDAPKASADKGAEEEE